ncbi:MAG: Hcp family type VI secretion system effector [Candidatus Methylumidiphilus sp.]
MAVDMFINMGSKIKGETKDKAQYKTNDIDVLAWSWGMSQSTSSHVGGGGGSGKVSIQDLSFTKYVDSATPAILLHCCKGTHIDKVKMIVRKAGGNQEKYIDIEMEHVLISGVSTGGSGGEDRLTENVTLNFAKVKYEYFKQDDKGAVKSAGEMTWDIQANSPG